MVETKPWYQSIGIWAALVALLTAALRLFRVELDPQLQRDLADWLLSTATVIGAGAALWGRWRASRRIATTPTLPAGASNGQAASAADTDLFRRIIPAVLLGSIALGLGGCAALSSAGSPGAAYVAADRATYEAVSPSYRTYVTADPALSAEEKDRRSRTIETWRIRLESAEKSGTGTMTAP